MSDLDSFEAFAKAYADPTSPGYNNAKKAYQYLHPDVTPESAKKSGSRMMKDPRVQAHIVAFRERARIVSGKTHEEYLAFGWKLMEKLSEQVVVNPKLATGLAKVYETVGKAGGWLVQRTEDMTPLERRIPLTAAEAVTKLEERLHRMKGMNEPLPLPSVQAQIAPPLPTEDALEVEYDTLPTPPSSDDDSDDSDAEATALGAVHAG